MRRAARLLGAVILAAVVVAALGPLHLDPGGIWRTLGGATRAQAAAGAGGVAPTGLDSFTPELGLPVDDIELLGASPGEAPGEAWAYGRIGAAAATVQGHSYSEQEALLERTEAGGWQVVPLPAGEEEQPLDTKQDSQFPRGLGALGGQATYGGGVVLLTEGGLVTRDPGGEPQLAPAPAQSGTEAVLGTAESAPPQSPPSGDSTAYAALDEAEGRTGALLAPYHDGAKPSKGEALEPGILHYDGTRWTREPIELPAGLEAGFTPEALACGGTAASPQASSPQNCWLLAAYHAAGPGTSVDRLALFQRVASAEAPGYAWKQAPVPSDWLLGEAAPPSGASELRLVPLGPEAQMLTATDQGVWVDFQADVDGPSTPVDVSELLRQPGAATLTNDAASGEEAEKLAPVGTWCYPTGLVCTAQQTLGAMLPSAYRSFAWSGAAPEDPGTRIVTGLNEGVMLELYEGGGGGFAYVPGAGGGGASAAALAMSAGGVVEGFVNVSGSGIEDRQGEAQIEQIGTHPAGDQLQQEAVPFREPLLALAQAPGTTPGEAGAQAVAVGAGGQIGRYEPGVGWRSEALYNSKGEAETSDLRGVAWPEAGRIYAVGDNGAMWLWRAETGLWEDDPAKPLNFIGNLTAIAFSPTNPDLGYAVGKQGVVLRFGKSWEQEPLPSELAQVNFTSVAFAGSEALATYRTVAPAASGGPPQDGIETGGLAVDEGSGWHIEPEASRLLEGLPERDRLLSKVAGLPNGGAVAAGPGLVIEREPDSSSWQLSSQPLPEAQNISALAAYSEPSGATRAVVSIDLDERLNPGFEDGNLEQSRYSGDVPAPTGEGQPPARFAPDPLPNSGYVLRQTASGWEDMEHAALPSGDGADLPLRPDPVLALLVSPSGEQGLAVGGHTDSEDLVQQDVHTRTAAAMHFPASVASGDGSATPVPIPTEPGDASFMIGAQAACAKPCANQVNLQLGPDAWLTHALAEARRTASESPGGLRAFLYAGGRLESQPAAGKEGEEAFERELGLYASLLASGEGSPPVYAASSPDVAPPGEGEGPLLEHLGAFMPGHPPGAAYYAVQSTGSSGGAVMVIVLDYSTGALGTTQEAFLREQLADAKTAQEPAIVMGNDALGFTLPQADNAGPNEASDAAAVTQILVEGGASAYFFDYPGSNIQTTIDYKSLPPVPVYGTGTLGYTPARGLDEADNLGSSGYLLAEVETAARNAATNVAPVHVRVVPNVSELALAATGGNYLRRSHVALFEALARRSAGGEKVVQGNEEPIETPESYDRIPFDCQGGNCAYQVPVEAIFSSSEQDIGGFVEHDPAYSEPTEVQLGADGKPIPDEPLRGAHGELLEEGGHLVNERLEAIPGDESGLFCAYNPGSTVVSITTGGLTYSMPVTVTGGSSEEPCGTVPLVNPPPAEAKEARFSAEVSPSPPPPPSAAQPAQPSPNVQAIAPPPPPPPVAHTPAPPHAIVYHHPPAPAPVLPFVAPLAPELSPPPALVPPPAPPVARPIPPSGTSQVQSSQIVGAPQDKREEQAATDMARASFAAYEPHEGHGPGPWLPVGLAVVAAGAGVGLRRGGRRGRPVFARATSGRQRRR